MQTRKKIEKRQRILMLLGLLLVTSLMTWLLLYALGSDSLSLFKQPHEIQQNGVKPDQNMRIGGLVLEGSYQGPDRKNLNHYFEVSDCIARVKVVYKGLLPDLFREGQGVVIQGKFNQDAVFIASEVLAKHDENYAPKGSMPKNIQLCNNDLSYPLITKQDLRP